MGTVAGELRGNCKLYIHAHSWTLGRGRKEEERETKSSHLGIFFIF